MGTEDEDITIDLRLRDYLAASARDAAAAIDELGDKTSKTARKLLLLDKRADKAANSLLKLAAAARTSSAAMGQYDASLDGVNKNMAKQIQTHKSYQSALGKTSKAKKDAAKKASLLSQAMRVLTRSVRVAGLALMFLGKAMAIFTAGAIVASAVQPILAVAGALSTLLSFAALIPTALGAVAAVGLTMTTAFKGLGPILKAAASGDVKVLNELMKDMPASAKSWFNEMVPVFKLYKGLRKEIQGELFETLTGAIPEAMRRMQPIVRSGTKSIIREVAGLANRIGSFFSQESGQRMFQRFFMGGTQLVRALEAGIGPLLVGLSDMIEAVSPVWDKLMQSFGSGLGNFGKWLSRISEDGSLERWLNTAAVTAQNLWNVLKQVGSIISGLVQAAGGADGGAGALGAFGTALGEISKWVNSMEGQTALQSFFSSLGTIVRAVAPVIETIAEIIGNILSPALAGMVTALAPSVNQFFVALGGALQIIAPYLPPLAAAFGQLLVALTPLLPIIGQLVAVALQNLAGMLPALVPLVTMFAQAFSVILGPALQLLAPLFQMLLPYIQLFFQTFTAALAPLLPQLEILGQMFATVIQEHMGRLVEMLPTLIPLIMQLAVQFGTFLVQALAMLMPYLPQIFEFLGLVMNVSLQMAPVILQLASVFVYLLGSSLPLLAFLLRLVDAGMTLGNAFMSLAQTAINAFLRLVGGVTSSVSTVRSTLERLKGMAGSIAGPFVSAVGSIVSAFGRISGAVSGAIGSIGNLIDKARNLASIDINPFRFAGGPVEAGTKYTVGEIGPEMFVPKGLGKPQMIGQGGMESRTFPSDGFIIPSFMLGAFKAIERGMEGMASSAPTEGVSAKELAAIAAGAGEVHQSHYHIPITVQGNAKDVDKHELYRTVRKAVEDVERERRERG